MTEILLIIVVCQLAYLIHWMKKPHKPHKDEKKPMQYQKVLPDYANKLCEITVKEPLLEIDIMFSVTGRVKDYDESWVILEIETKKKTTSKMIRISNITGIKEIR